ncbi:hypothetical protein HY029_01705 [Candidatus Gottesmanbacteria bacterium]|nr:hypothetical protein [Candidatus Gottesmanbacteria bacterium]
MAEETKSNSVSQPATANPLSSRDCGTTLYLTLNIRSIQQDEMIKKKKLKMKGKLFTPLSSPPHFCNTNRIAVAKTRNGIINSFEFAHLGCNSWRCPTCSIKKAAYAKWLIMNVAQLNDLSYFLSLTLRPDKIPKEYFSDGVNNTHSYITKLFNLFSTQLKRKTYLVWNKKLRKYIKFSLKNSKTKLKYVWVIEFTPKGIFHLAHLHILLNKFLPIEALRKEWKRIGGGQQMKIEPARSISGVSRYITDYIAKGLKQSNSGKGFIKYFEKRYAISKSCKRPNNTNFLSVNNLSIEDKRRFSKIINSYLVYNTIDKLSIEDKTFNSPAPNNSS